MGASDGAFSLDYLAGRGGGGVCPRVTREGSSTSRPRRTQKDSRHRQQGGVLPSTRTHASVGRIRRPLLTCRIDGARLRTQFAPRQSTGRGRPKEPNRAVPFLWRQVAERCSIGFFHSHPLTYAKLEPCDRRNTPSSVISYDVCALETRQYVVRRRKSMRRFCPTH